MPIFQMDMKKNFFEPQKNFLATPFLPTKIFRFFKTKNLGKKLRSCTQKKRRAKVCLRKFFRIAKKLASQSATPKATKKGVQKKPFSNGKNG